MAAKRATDEQREQAAIDAEFLVQRLGNAMAAGVYAGVSDNTIRNAIKLVDNLGRVTARKLREAAKRVETHDPGAAQRAAIREQSQEQRQQHDTIDCTKTAITHFERGFKALQQAGDAAMPIARPGFAKVEDLMRRVIHEYLDPIIE